MISGIFISDIVIVRHPVSVCVPVNHEVILSVRAESACSLQYRWFTDDEGAVCEVCDTISKSLTDSVRLKKHARERHVQFTRHMYVYCGTQRREHAFQVFFAGEEITSRCPLSRGCFVRHLTLEPIALV